MTTRLYFLVADETSAEKITAALHQQDINDDNIYAVARRDKYPLKEDIPDAGILERSDIINAAKRGATVGGTAGLFAGLTAALITPLGLIVGGGAIAGLTAAGVVAGSWMSTMIGISVPNTKLKVFEAAIESGEILMLADVEDGQADAIKDSITQAYPSAVIGSGELQ